jgi:aryl-alcohol dehydrogenase-like predicted oxidoreductase
MAACSEATDCPIPGTRKQEHLKENIGAVKVELTSEDLHEIDSAASNMTIQGARYPEDLEKRTGLRNLHSAQKKDYYQQ